MRELNFDECNYVAGGQDIPDADLGEIVVPLPEKKRAVEVVVHMPIMFGIGPSIGYASGSYGGDYVFTGIGFGTPSVSVSDEDHDSGDARPNGETTSSLEVQIGTGVSGSAGTWSDMGQTQTDRINTYSERGMPGYVPQ